MLLAMEALSAFQVLVNTLLMKSKVKQALCIHVARPILSIYVAYYFINFKLLYT